MSVFNQHQDSISTVQLSPFGEEQWHRIVTYSPIYVHWTDMVMMSQQQQRIHKTNPGKLNLISQIDLNTLKLEDEILLNELYDIRKAAAVPVKGKKHQSKVFDNEQDHEIASTTNNYHAPSDFSQESKELSKHHCSYAEPSIISQPYSTKHPNSANQSISAQGNSNNQVKGLPHFSLGPKFQPSLGVQLRQSAMTREHALSGSNDHRSSTPLSMSSSKRTITSAHSSQRHHPQQQQQYRRIQSPLSNELNPAANIHEQLTGESATMRRVRARSTNSSRSTMRMLKTRNDRTRKKRNVELKTLLVEPWKQAPWGDATAEEIIPNSIEIMHKMCGPATPFERNLRHSYHRQLNQYRYNSMKS